MHTYTWAGTNPYVHPIHRHTWNLKNITTVSFAIEIQTFKFEASGTAVYAQTQNSNFLKSKKSLRHRDPVEWLGLCSIMMTTTLNKGNRFILVAIIVLTLIGHSEAAFPITQCAPKSGTSAHACSAKIPKWFVPFNCFDQPHTKN